MLRFGQMEPMVEAVESAAYTPNVDLSNWRHWRLHQFAYSIFGKGSNSLSAILLSAEQGFRKFLSLDLQQHSSHSVDRLNERGLAQLTRQS